MNTTVAIVRFQKEGFHMWSDAPPARSYLAQRHRHMFHVEAQIALKHDEREIEFHDFLDFCKANFPGGELGSQSCETMARKLIDLIYRKWPYRAISVSVFEDSEVGAIVSMKPFEQEEL